MTFSSKTRARMRHAVAGALAAASVLAFSGAASAQLPSPTYGWNLGNTMEPPCGVGCWAPAPTQALINSVANAGFNVVRIPCAWDSHANQTTKVIDPAYIAQVKQVVDWCYARNLYVVINCHWDGGWLENNVTTSVNATINAKMQSYWSQIATAFASYDSKLLFAGANEPAVDTAGKMATLTAYYNTFISAVRATGGNNSTRWLVVQGPSTDINTTDTLMNTLPTDPTPGKLMVEVHYYDPYQYTLMTADERWGAMFYFWGAAYHSSSLPTRNANWGEEAGVDAQFQKMTAKFVNNGIPVLLGEVAAIRRTTYPDITGANLGLHLASRTFFNKYVFASANSHGLKPVYWDDSSLTNNGMGLFDRTTAALVDTDVSRTLFGGPALPPPPANVTASPDNGQIIVSWSASSGAVSYNIFRSTASGGEGTSPIASGIATTSYTNTGLTNGTRYYYTVAAVNGPAVSPQSAEASAIPVVPPVPAAPTNLAVTGVASAQVGLSWTASANANNYAVKRSTTSGGPYGSAGSTAATSYNDTSVSNGVTYYYVVSASNSSGSSGNSNQVSAVPNPIAPPTNLTNSPGPGRISVMWTQSTSGFLAGNKIYQSSTSGGPYSLIKTLTPAGTSYTLGAAKGVTYYYVVTAYNSLGESANSNQTAGAAR
jgi:endoglucanase